jgi:hypothetical protein
VATTGSSVRSAQADAHLIAARMRADSSCMLKGLVT